MEKKDEQNGSTEISGLSIIENDKKLVLSWKLPNNTDIKNIELSMSPNEGTLTNPVILGKEVKNFIVSELTNNKTYTIKIKTIDSKSNYSNGVTKIASPISSNEDNTPPSDVALRINSAKDGVVELSWNKPSDIDLKGYKLSASPAAGTLKEPKILDKNVTTFTVSGLSNATQYTFTIQSFDNKSNYSTGTSQFTSLLDSSDRIPPSEVTMSNIPSEYEKAVITWTNPTDPDLLGVELSAIPMKELLNILLY